MPRLRVYTDRRFYVYVHLTADAKIPFYVGKGSNNRAWDWYQRNVFWSRVVRRHGVMAELLHTDLTENEAMSKEIEEIQWFRQYYTLANICEGGEGVSRPAQVAANKDAIRRFIQEFGRFPSSCRPEEHGLRAHLTDYCSPGSRVYDEDFTEEMSLLGYGTKSAGLTKTSVKLSKEGIVSFYGREGRLPSAHSDDVYERRMRGRLERYCNPSISTYDADFHAWAKSVGYGLGSAGRILGGHSIQRKTPKQEDCET